ncbi:MAG: hypothetical protein JWM57_292 [Phycisphaerales bacterium]|nr:hypothetical protein [Phycisphaerales bacterium]
MPSQPIPYEPFGQTGVRQYMGRMLAWVFVTCSLCAAAMAQRSSGFLDEARWGGQGQMLRVVSANSQLAVFGGTTSAKGHETGWKYGGAYLGQIGRYGRPRPWASSLNESLGMEVSLTPPMREMDAGFLLRMKWTSMAALFMVQPLVYVLMRWRRRRAEARVNA